MTTAGVAWIVRIPAWLLLKYPYVVTQVRIGPPNHWQSSRGSRYKVTSFTLRTETLVRYECQDIYSIHRVNWETKSILLYELSKTKIGAGRRGWHKTTMFESNARLQLHNAKSEWHHPNGCNTHWFTLQDRFIHCHDWISRELLEDFDPSMVDSMVDTLRVIEAISSCHFSLWIFVQPPFIPIQIILSNTLVSSPFLHIIRFEHASTSQNTDLSFNPSISGPHLFSMPPTLSVSSSTWLESSCNLSSTVSLRLDCDREERHCSPMIIDAATVNRKPSARKLVPFSTALKDENQKISTRPAPIIHLVSDNGRIWRAGSPRIFVRSLISVRWRNWARSIQTVRKRSCLQEWVLVLLMYSTETYSLAWFLILAAIGLATV